MILKWNGMPVELRSVASDVWEANLARGAILLVCASWRRGKGFEAALWLDGRALASAWSMEPQAASNHLFLAVTKMQMTTLSAVLYNRPEVKL